MLLASLLASAAPVWAQATVPAPAPDAETGVLADPAPDPELLAPLAPLATFDAQPPAPAEATQRDTERPSAITYALTVEGLDSHGLKDRFKDLSVLKDGEGDRVTGAQIDARIEADTELALRLLRSEGYYAARVDAVSEPVEGAENRVRVVLTATPGTRYRFGRIDIRPAHPRAAAVVDAEFPLSPGDPLVAADVETAEALILLRLPQEGFPFATVGARDVVLDDAAATGDYSAPVATGPLSTFGTVRLSGRRLPFSARHAGNLARFDRGDIYDSRLAEDLRRATVATGLFSGVSVKPVDSGEIAPDGTRVVDVEISGERGPQRQLAASAGYGTGDGLRLEGLWRHRNLFPPEGALTARAVAGTREQRLGTEFRRSNAGQRDRTVLVLAEAANEVRDAYNARTFTLSGRLARESTPIWQKRWTYAAGLEFVASDEVDRSRQLRTGETRIPRRTFLTAAVPLQLGYDRSDSLLDPTRGFRLLGRISPEGTLQSGGFTYVRSQLEGSAYVGLGDSFVLAGRLRGGAIFGAPRGRIAPTRRFYAGGGGSVRGFGYQELGDRDPDGDPLGGRSLAEASVEARYRFGDFGAVAFIDAGQLYTSTLPTFSDMRTGVGIGARYYTGFGPIRVDLARPLARRKGEPQVAVYVSIGQAF
ncbi:MAG: BamA/TamA family outer membrane protein [Alphaproteobacteria bacterium]|nr:BamA/TamA family outer membrane protein [Alphaproteobacteria bacterium]